MPYRDKNKEKETRRFYHQSHRVEILRRMRDNRQRYKVEALIHYGNSKLACVECGFDDARALSIDHINGGGIKHRLTVSGSGFYRWLKKHNYPEGFQTLCMNCQYVKRVNKKEYE